MKDKHGKMIFEGDIISAPFTDYSLSGGSRTEYVLGEVYYNNLGWCVDFPESDIVSLEEFHYWDIEAVGNIYDNPEMLEQKI